jgi:hypothetical protein
LATTTSTSVGGGYLSRGMKDDLTLLSLKSVKKLGQYILNMDMAAPVSSMDLFTVALDASTLRPLRPGRRPGCNWTLTDGLGW